MSGNVFTMENKQEIYSSWVQYTTKNEESHFRHFIKGFVAIWEAQLKLEWSDIKTLPDWNTVKDDFGPHLSRLPEELLPAIGKFIFIAKDNVDRGGLQGEAIVEVDLLIRCLTAISRNFDNIPLIASCDFVSQAVGIANAIIHQMVAGDYVFEAEAREFCINLCHFLECLYDPYLMWRHFLQTSSPPPPHDRLAFHPALLHNEIVPFIYECFETEIVTQFPELSREMLSVLGAVVCGANHNALRGICPATVNLVTSVVSLPTVDSDVQLTALKCFTAMVTVLHRSLPHERQIEVTTVLEKLREVMLEVMSRDQKISVPTLLQLVLTLPNILAATHSMQSLQSLMVEAKLIDTLLDILDQTADRHKNHMELVVTIISALNKLVIGSVGGKERMAKVSGYPRIFSCLSSLETPTKKLLEVLIAMITEEEDSICLKDMKLINSEPLVPFIHWMGELAPDEQVWLACTLEEICTNSLQSKATACKSGVVVAICQLMSSAAVDPRAATHLILLVETLASYSVTARELKQLFLLLRTNQEKVNPYRNLLVAALLEITRKAGLQLHCDSYFDIEQQTDGITISDMRKWNGAVYGFSFHCWLRLEPIHVSSPINTPPRRQIFK